MSSRKFLNVAGFMVTIIIINSSNYTYTLIHFTSLFRSASDDDEGVSDNESKSSCNDSVCQSESTDDVQSNEDQQRLSQKRKETSKLQGEKDSSAWSEEPSASNSGATGSPSQKDATEPFKTPSPSYVRPLAKRGTSRNFSHL